MVEPRANRINAIFVWIYGDAIYDKKRIKFPSLLLDKSIPSRVPIITDLRDQTVDQDAENAEIECRTESPQRYKFSWMFTKVHRGDNRVHQTVIETAGDCRGRSGPYQLQFRPNILVVCNLNYTLHEGSYTCIVQDEYTLAEQSKSMTLKIQGAGVHFSSPTLFV